MYFQDMVIFFMKLSIKIHTTTIKPQTIMAETKEAALKNQETAKLKKEKLSKRDQAYTTTTRTTPPVHPDFFADSIPQCRIEETPHASDCDEIKP